MERIEGKNVKLLVDEGLSRPTIFHALVLHQSDDFLTIKDKFGKIVDVRVSSIVRVERDDLNERSY